MLLGRRLAPLCLLLTLLVAPVAARAQYAPVPAGGGAQVFGAFVPHGNAALAATTTSANVAVPSVGPVAWVYNAGPSTAYVLLGTTSAVAATTTTGFPVQPGTAAALKVEDGPTINTYAAAVTASDTASLTITTGTGSPTVVAGGAGGTVGTSPAPTASSAAAIAPVVSPSAPSSLVLKAAPGNLYRAVFTAGATAGYAMVVNLTAAPTSPSSVAPTHCEYVPANGTDSFSADGDPPESYSTGITMLFSSTGCFTYTSLAAAFMRGSVQ